MNIEKLNQLSITDLNTIYDVIDSGKYDGYSIDSIEVQAKGYQYGHEKWKEKIKERSKLLREIKEILKTKIQNILE